MIKLSIIKEVLEFLIASKKWWLFPIIIFLLSIGFLVVLTQGSVVTPFIYTIF